MTTALAHPFAPPPAAATETRTYTVSFTTPAFLGNAHQQAQWRTPPFKAGGAVDAVGVEHQQAQWRTPPFKALIREWWRIVRAGELLGKGADAKTLHRCIRTEEAVLFGNAWIKDREGNLLATRSSVRLRLSSWAEGTPWDRSEAGKGPRVSVPGASTGARNGFNAFIYAGFGPLSTEDKVFNPRSAIMPTADAALEVSFPTEHETSFDRALRCIQLFGAVGSRSRNGWGSVQLAPPPAARLGPVLARWQDCLALDWPHRVGTDEHGALRWRLKRPVENWQSAITEIAILRKRINLAVSNPPGVASERHVLSDPVTKNSGPAGGPNARLASQLRFKVLAERHELRPTAFHIPCAVPDALGAPGLMRLQENAWKKVHAAIGADSKWERAK